MENKSLFERWVFVIQNNRIFAIIILVCFIISAIIGFWKTISDFIKSFKKEPQTEKSILSPIIDSKLVVDKITDSSFHFYFNISNSENTDAKRVSYAVNVMGLASKNSGQIDESSPYSVISAKSIISQDPFPIEIKYVKGSPIYVLLLITYYDTLDKPHNCFFSFLNQLPENIMLKEYNPLAKRCENELPDPELFGSNKGNISEGTISFWTSENTISEIDEVVPLMSVTPDGGSIFIVKDGDNKLKVFYVISGRGKVELDYDLSKINTHIKHMISLTWNLKNKEIVLYLDGKAVVTKMIYL